MSNSADEPSRLHQFPRVFRRDLFEGICAQVRENWSVEERDWVSVHCWRKVVYAHIVRRECSRDPHANVGDLTSTRHQSVVRST